MAYTWPYAILLPWRGPCAYTPLWLSNMRATSVASAPPSTDFQIAISTIGPFLSGISMFPHSLLLPSFWFIKPSLLPYFLFPKLCLFFKTSCHILSTCTWNQSESCHHKNIDALNVCTFACALALKIRYDYTFHNAPTFGGVSSHRAESASNLIYTLNRVLVRSVVDGCRLMCMPICQSVYLILFQISYRNHAVACPVFHISNMIIQYAFLLCHYTFYLHVPVCFPSAAVFHTLACPN